MGKLRIFTVLLAALVFSGTSAAKHDAAFWSQQPLRLGNDYFVRSLTQSPDDSLLVAGDRLRIPPASDGSSPFRRVFLQSHGVDGRMKWNLSLNAQGSAEFAQLAYDSVSGDLIAVGRSWPAEGQPDIFAARISDSGRVQWMREYREEGIQQANSVAAIGGVGAVIAGFTIPLRDVPAEPDGLLLRIDNEGRELWRYQTASRTNTSFSDVVVHDDGRITVAGLTYEDVDGTPISSSDVILLTFDADGNLLWQVQFGSDADDTPFKLAVTADSDLVMFGNTAGTLGFSSGSVDFFVARYSTDGEQLWLQQFGGNDEDKVLALSADESGRIYVGGILGMNVGDDQMTRMASFAEATEAAVHPLAAELRIEGAVGGSTILFSGDTASLLMSVNAGEGWRLVSLPSPEVIMEPATGSDG